MIGLATVISVGLATWLVASGMLQYSHLMYGLNALNIIADCKTQSRNTSFINVPPVNVPLRHGRRASDKSLPMHKSYKTLPFSSTQQHGHTAENFQIAGHSRSTCWRPRLHHKIALEQ